MIENRSNEQMFVAMAIRRGEYLIHNAEQTEVDDEMYLVQCQHMALQKGMSKEALYIGQLHENLSSLLHRSPDTY